MRRTPHIHALILASIGLVGCDRPGSRPAATPSQLDGGHAPPPAPAQLDGGSASTTATAQPDTATPPPAGTRKLGETCETESECAPLHCAFPFDGAEFSKPGTCVTEQPIYKGRPLVVDGSAHVATRITVEPSAPPLDASLAAELVRSAFEEHASIAAFARTISELLALGAPLDLVRATQQALADEIAHAEETLKLAQASGAGAVTFGPLPQATAARTAGDLAAALLVDVVRGGCIGETLAACSADRQSKARPELAGFYRRIAEDEARHAALAFDTARWLLRERPDLRATVEELLAAFVSGASADDVAQVAPLLPLLRA